MAAPTRLEVEMAEIIIDDGPLCGMVRMVSSGTEATMSAIRLARGYTCREKIIKFEGCYHGHADSLLVSAGRESPLSQSGMSRCPGGTLQNIPFLSLLTMSKPLQRPWGWRDPRSRPVIVEPIPGNMGVVLPDHLPESTEGSDCKEWLFANFRRSHQRFSRGARRSPGTLWCSAGYYMPGEDHRRRSACGCLWGQQGDHEKHGPRRGASIKRGRFQETPWPWLLGLQPSRSFEKKGFYKELEEKSRRLFAGLDDAANSAGIKIVVQRVGSMGSLFFTDQPVTDFVTGQKERYRDVHRGFIPICLIRDAVSGAFPPLKPGSFPQPHEGKEIDKTIESAAKSLLCSHGVIKLNQKMR